LLNKTPKSSSIVLDDIDPSSKWVVETQRATFDNEDLSWMDLDPLPQPEDSNIVVGQYTIKARGIKSESRFLV